MLAARLGRGRRWSITMAASRNELGVTLNAPGSRDSEPSTDPRAEQLFGRFAKRAQLPCIVRGHCPAFVPFRFHPVGKRLQLRGKPRDLPCQVLVERWRRSGYSIAVRIHRMRLSRARGARYWLKS